MDSIPANIGIAGDNEKEITGTKSGIKYDIQSDENYKKLKEEKKKLKKDLLIKDSEINSLKKALEERDRDTKSNYIPLNEARKITYKALRKGSAAQKIVNLILGSSINYKLKKNALNTLLVNAYGIMHNKKNHNYPEILKYTDSHLKLFRQEQLILLAENERLTIQMKDLKKQLLDNKIDILKKNENKLFYSMKKITKNGNNYNSNISNSNINNLDKSENDYIELDADLVEKNFIKLIKNIQIAQFKLLCYAFRKLTNNFYCNSRFNNQGLGITSALKYSTENLNKILKYKKFINLCTSFYKLLLYNQNNYIYNGKNCNYNNVNINPYENNNYSRLKKKSNNNEIANYVFKPYYYDNLPSAMLDIKNKKYSFSKIKDNSIIKNSIQNVQNYYDQTDTIGTCLDPFFYENQINKPPPNNYYPNYAHNNNNHVSKNAYFNMGLNKTNDKCENDSYAGDYEYLKELNSYEKEKFIDMFITESNKR
ncbi:conserved Plasmodium protein, unknown function [Plasmodium vinckei brucechwatti]|uniref:Uncharacterized protein n=1 Tax=Plasmodium vinckei brucechwatti TaxID=119398 RepID=A0A6V7SMY3_PLAVN|nr:conserved Plasmodium protein, unknown function [Plasmodium vinckei brucechwatti]